MPSVMTYSSLVSSVQSWCERVDSNFTNAIPTMIANAEQRIARELKSLGTSCYVTSAMSAGQSVYAKPTLWRETISINFGNGTGSETRNQLFKRPYDYIRAFWPDPTQTGTPQYYADYGYGHIIVAPTPSANFPYEWSFWQIPTPLDDTNQTNWLTQFAPDILLYATLSETAPFLKGDERLAVWEQQYQTRAAAFKTENLERIGDSASSATKGP